MNVTISGSTLPKSGVLILLAVEGAKLLASAKSVDDATGGGVAAAIKAAGFKGKSGQVLDMVDEALNVYGKIDALFNNAGIIKPAMLWKMTPEQWEDVIRINLTGKFYCLQAVAKPMIEQQSGSIINVTSSAGLVGTIGQLNYTAAKGGVYAMTKSAAKELARYRIRVNNISPMAETEMTNVISSDSKFKEKYLERIPLGRFGQPEEIGSAVVFLVSDESSYITGQTICIDGGMVMP